MMNCWVDFAAGKCDETSCTWYLVLDLFPRRGDECKYRMLDKDQAVFFLSLELCDSNPSQEGLTKKNLVLDMDSRQVEFSSWHTWFDCKFILRMKEVKIFISV